MLFDNSSNYFEPFSLAAGKSKSNADILTLSQMRKQDDKEDFEAAMTKEIDTMFNKDIYQLHPRQDVPRGKRVLPAIWSFRRKRTPDGTVYKHRARLCAHGGRQIEGIDYEETYAPVVSWTTVRFLFILSLMNNLESRQIDYVQAFPQADLQDEVYMQLPHGYNPPKDKEYVLKLNKNLYGLKQAAFNWFEHLKSGL